MGHPCCGVFRCTNPLGNNRDRFCPEHFEHHGVCAISECEQPTLKGSKACSLPDHQEMERLNKARGTAAFILKERLQRHRVAHLNDALVVEQDTSGTDVEEDIQWFETNGLSVQIFNAPDPGSVGTSDLPCDQKSATGNRKFKARFGRLRTHNEQTLVRPCGVIVARATFFGAEAVSNVLVRALKAHPCYVLMEGTAFCQENLLSSGCSKTRAFDLRYQL
jgi:hypothetical protein